jgi:ribosomal protein L40E
MNHFISATAGGKCAMCERSATHKVGEEIPPDEPCMRCGAKFISPAVYPEEARAALEACHSTFHMRGPDVQRHNLTAYVCCRCFTRILGGATGCPVETKTTVVLDKREWILLQRVRVSDDGKTLGYTALECAPNGAALLPADVKYIEFPTEELYGNDA